MAAKKRKNRKDEEFSFCAFCASSRQEINASSGLNYQTPTLLVHGERDGLFPASDARKLAAVVLAILALGPPALHFVPPRMEVSAATFQIARDHLVPAQRKQDFEVLAGLPIWKGQKLGTLLAQVELANYTVRELVNWKLDDAIYRDFVLSPDLIRLRGRSVLLAPFGNDKSLIRKVSS